MHRGLAPASPAPDRGNPRPGPTRAEGDRHGTDPDVLPPYPSGAKIKHWLYHLRPSVQDKFHTIELHWGLSRESQEPAKSYLSMESNPPPAIDIATEELEEPERYQIKNTILSHPGLSINKFERIFVDIPVRNFVLKSIPGLRIFVFQDAQPLPGIKTVLNTPSLTFVFGELPSYFNSQAPLTPQRHEILQTRRDAPPSGVDIVPLQGTAAGIPPPIPPRKPVQLSEYVDEYCRPKKRKAEMPQTPMTVRASSFSPHVALSSQPRSLHDENQHSPSLPQSVEGLLQRYTTLYDNHKIDDEVAKP